MLVLLYMPPTPDNLWQPVIRAALGAGWLAALFLLPHPMADEILRLLQHGHRLALTVLPRPLPSRI
jgi:hypothetical protein